MFTIDASFRALQVQRRRSRGWRMPEGAIYVGRPTKWGNPYEVYYLGKKQWLVFSPDGSYRHIYNNEHAAREQAILLYRIMMERVIKDDPHALDELKGHPLACWCAKGLPCHRDVLIELAN